MSWLTSRLSGTGISIARSEWRPTAWAAAWFFTLMSGYYILRPMRESALTLLDAKRGEQRWAFYGTFVGILVWLAIYSALAGRLSRRKLVASVHHFAAFSQLVFWWTYIDLDRRPIVYITTLYIWINVLGLFSVAVVWSALADIFSKEQSERLFGPIAVGATVGGMAGSAAVPWLVDTVGMRHILLVPLVLFELSLFCQAPLDRWATRQVQTKTPNDQQPPAAPTNPFGGLIDVCRSIAASPYLSLICAHLLTHALLGAAVYLLTNEFVAAQVEKVADRTALFANVNWFTQLMTLPMQAIGMHWLISVLGVPLAMCLLPCTYFIAFAGLAWNPTLQWLLAIDIARRTVTYGLESPTRAALFTVTTRGDKYRTKAFLDTFVVRGGEATSQEAINFLRRAAPDPVAVARLLAPVAIGWIAISFIIGRMYQDTKTLETDSPRPPA